MPSTVSSDRVAATGGDSSRILLSVVTVNWNSRGALAACLGSWSEQTYADFEVLIKDNALEDDSLEMVRARFSQFVLREVATAPGS